ncbi:MAG: SDR family NAD(P)-dependent oxidoreductase [Sciscionella sp.]|nr:SDR family NAD(P)-dependent oxidoreductase [Sciscionella sp.]
MTEHENVILITGATSGLGRYLAQRLATRETTLLIHGRDPLRTKELAESIGARYYVADLASLAEVRALARQVRTDNDKLTLLINNAGVGGGSDPSKRELSADGHELRFAVNYLAPYVLTRALLPSLRAGASKTCSQGRASTLSRVVNVGSAGQSPIDFDDLRMDRGYDGFTAYCRSKLALAMFTFDLAGELDGAGVTANVLHPATFMDTAMVRASGITPVNTIEHGGQATLRVALEFDGVTGQYFDEDRPARAHPDAYDPAKRTRLRELTEELLASSVG